jgi:hypothetical protein
MGAGGARLSDWPGQFDVAGSLPSVEAFTNSGDFGALHGGTGLVGVASKGLELVDQLDVEGGC